jgi:hypothetical protein
VRGIGIGAAVAGLLCGASLAAPVSVPSGLYAVTAETLLPHLEENLRYATTVTRRCLGTQDATTLFPLLAHEAFAGCTLAPEPGTADETRFTLRCHNPEAATGAARFTFGDREFRALLDIKMGAKNMTLSQRITAPRLGPCPASD